MDKRKKGNGLITTALGILALVTTFNHPLPDLAYLGIKLGEHIARRHQLPPPDMFSFLPVNAGWWDTSWLWSLISYGLFGLRIDAVLRAFAGLLAVPLTILIYRSALKGRMPRFAASILTLFIIMILNESFSFKPILPSMVLFLLQMLILEKRRGQLFFIPLIYLPWSQIDLSYFAGLAYLIGYVAAESTMTRKRKILLPVLAILGALPSPNSYYLITRPFTLDILFQRTPDFHIIANLLQGLVVFAGLGGAAFQKERSGRAVGLCILAFMGLMGGEYFPLAVLAAVPILAEAGDRLTEEMKLGAPRIFRAAVIAALVVAIFTLPLAYRKDIRNGRTLMDFVVRHNIFGAIFGPWQTGGRLVWATGKKIAVDERPGLYPAETRYIYTRLSVTEGSQWDEFARSYNIGGIIVPKLGTDYGAMASRPDWALVFENETYAYFVRNEGMNTTLVERWGRLKPTIGLNNTPSDLATELANQAEKWEEKGNPYRARGALLVLEALNPNNAAASIMLNDVNGKIYDAEARQ